MRLMVFSAALFFFVAQIGAQTATGTLSGTVQDESGGVLPGVTVTVISESTGAVRTTISNHSGVYRIPALRPGSYELKAELPQFKTFQRSGILVTVGESLTVDVTLSVGQVEEVVLVTAGAASLDLEDSQISTLVDSRRVVDLPLNGRNVYTLANLQPGVVQALASVANTEGKSSSAFFSAGARFRGNSFTLDGQTNNDETISGLPIIVPNVDSVQEYRLIRNNFSAEFGTHSGTVVNVVTRSGSNEFHGGVWEFHRNDALDAAEVFDPVDAQTGDKDKAPLIQNQFGLTFGGPAVKNRLFFFGSYEGFREKSGESARVFVETPEFRQWVIDNNASSVAALLFKNFPAPAPRQNIKTVAQLDPKKVSFINPALPPANLPVLGTVDSFAPFRNANDQVSLRFDQIFNGGKDQIFGRYFVTDARTPDATIRNAFGDSFDGRSQSLNAAFMHTFSPTLINEARVAYLYGRSGFVPGSNPEVPTVLIDGPAGIQGASGLAVHAGTAFGSFFAIPQFFKRHTYQWQDILSLISGNHAIRTGVDVRRLHENGNFGSRTRPLFVYQGIFDFANDAPFLLQAGVNPATGALTDTPRYWRSTEIGLFVQDDWKLHPRFTLNLGIRWDYFQPPVETADRISNIIFPAEGGYFERIANARVGQVDTLYESDLNNFAPRVGFAWDFLGKGKAVLRGGYGISYEKLFFNVTGNVRFNPPFFGMAQLSPLSGHKVTPFLGKDGNDVFGGFAGIVVPGAELGLDEKGGIRGARINLRVVDPAIRDSYVHNVFLGIQQQLPWDLVGEVNYQGTFGRKLPFIGDPNRFNGDLLGRTDPLGRFGGDRKENRLNTSFRDFNLRQNRITSNYHGSNAQLRKPLGNGLSFQLAYTLGKSLDYNSDVFGPGENSGGLNGLPYRTFFADPLHVALDYGRSNFDVRRRFVANVIWEVPLLRNQDGLWSHVLGGWQINTIVPIQSGLPFGPLNGGNFPAGDYNADGQEGDRPNTPSFGNQFLDAPGTEEFIRGVFGPEDFPAPERGTNGTLGRNTFTGPSFWTVDLSLFKNFRLPLTEESKLQFRAEFFNLFNRVNLYLPAVDLNSRSFGTSSQAFDAREIQFALKFIF